MKYLAICVLALGLVACGNEEPEGETTSKEPNAEESIELKELRAENAELRAENARKDSVMRVTAEIYQEIQNNLAEIAYKEGRIRKQSLNIESTEDPKAFILQEIDEINKLREANALKVASLQSKLEEAHGEIVGLETLVEGLNNQIMIQEQEIEMLKIQLDNLDKDYSNMFDAYLDMADLAEEAMTKLNKAYYSYGTKKELKENGVITKEGGFIGIGRTNVLKADFNDEYFEEIDLTQTKEINIMGDDPELVTPHPSGTYELVEKEGGFLLKITNPEKFWGASKYLVVIVN